MTRPASDLQPSASSVTVAVSVAPLPATAEGETPRARERAAARALVRQMTGNPDAEITHGPQGEPQLSGFHISVSHSRTHVAIALSRTARPGIDIEPPSPRLARVVPRIMRPDEPAEIDPLRAWTAKEAVFKCAAVAGLVLSDIRLNAQATEAAVGARRFAVAHIGQGLALALEIPTPASR